jgi:hypothetical protein
MHGRILDDKQAPLAPTSAAAAAKIPCNWVLTKRVVAVHVIHSRHKNERQVPGNPHGGAGCYFNSMNRHDKSTAYFLIAKQKTLSKNRLTASL